MYWHQPLRIGSRRGRALLRVSESPGICTPREICAAITQGDNHACVRPGRSAGWSFIPGYRLAFHVASRRGSTGIWTGRLRPPGSWGTAGTDIR